MSRNVTQTIQPMQLSQTCCCRDCNNSTAWIMVYYPAGESQSPLFTPHCEECKRALVRNYHNQGVQNLYYWRRPQSV